jgi:MoxR-like ATPase
MRPSEAKQAVVELIKARESTMLWGPPGVSKSDLVRQAVVQVYGSLEGHYIDRRVACMDAVDVGGFPMPNGESMKFSRPDFVMTEGAGVIFLDEFAQGVPLVQAALTQFMLDRRIRDHQLGDGWAIIAAGNRAEDRAGANRLITPILNRLIHLDVEVSYEDWLFWAAEQGLAQEVLRRLCPLKGR